MSHRASHAKRRVVFGHRLALAGTHTNSRGFRATAWSGTWTTEYEPRKTWHWRARLEHERHQVTGDSQGWALRLVGSYRPHMLDSQHLTVALQVEAATRVEVLRKARKRLQTAMVALHVLEANTMRGN